MRRLHEETCTPLATPLSGMPSSIRKDFPRQLRHCTRQQVDNCRPLRNKTSHCLPTCFACHPWTLAWNPKMERRRRRNERTCWKWYDTWWLLLLKCRRDKFALFVLSKRCSFAHRPGRYFSVGPLGQRSEHISGSPDTLKPLSYSQVLRRCV